MSILGAAAFAAEDKLGGSICFGLQDPPFPLIVARHSATNGISHRKGREMVSPTLTAAQARQTAASKPIEVPFAGRLSKQFLFLQSLFGPLYVRRGNMCVEGGFVAPLHVEQEQSRILASL